MMAEKDSILHSISKEIQERLDKRKLTSDDLQETKCSQECLLRLSKEMDNWDTVGFYLKLTPPDIKAIKVDCKSEEERRIRMLNKWTEKQGQDATYSNLIEGLEEADRMDIVDIALDLLKETVEQAKQRAADEGVDSDTSLQEDLQLLCGCGRCTLDDFLKNGCPNPGVQRQFPLLNVNKLPADNNALALRLMLEAKEVNKIFGALLRKICQSLNAHEEINISELVVYIMSQQKCNFLNESHYMSTKQQLRDAKTKGEVMLIIEDQVSWFNHEFLGNLVYEFKIEINAYEDYVEKHLKPFLKKSLFEIPRKSSDAFEGSGQFTLKLSIPPPTEKLSANVIMILKYQVACALCLPRSTVEFCSYNSGCFELVFGAPHVILKEMLFHNEKLLLVLQNIDRIIPGVTVQAIKFDDQSQPVNPQKVVDGIFPLSSRMTKIDTMFASLVVQLVKSFVSRRISLQEIISFLTEDLLIQRSRHVMKDSASLFSSSLTTSITNLQDLMLFLNSYWSFFNYALLEKLIKRFGAQEVKDNILKSYITQLQELSLHEIPVILHHLPQVEGFLTEHLIVTIKHDFFSLSVDDLLLVHDSVARILRVERFALLLNQIKKDLKTDQHRLEFLIAHKTTQDDLLHQFSQLDLSSLNELHIVSIQFQGMERNQESKDINESDDDEVVSECTLDSGLESSIESDLEHIQISAQEEEVIETEPSLSQLTIEQSSSQSLPDTPNQPLSIAVIPISTTAGDDTTGPVEKDQQIYHYDSDRTETPVPSEKEEDELSDNDWPSLGETTKTQSQPLRTQVESQSIIIPLTTDSTSSNISRDHYDSKIPETHKGVKQVCGVCFDYEDNENKLIMVKCFYPNAHNAPHIHVGWNYKLKKFVSINPRPVMPYVKGLFQLCDSQQHQQRQHCMYAHNESERDAWNYDLIKEREAAGHNITMPVTVATIATSTSAILPSTDFTDTSFDDKSKHSLSVVETKQLKANTISPISTSNTLTNVASPLSPPVVPSPAEANFPKEKVKVPTSEERNDWKTSFTERVKKTVLQNKDIESELTTTNYRDKFYYLLCFEESEHIKILTKKCDGQYKIQCFRKLSQPNPQYLCRVLGMNDNQVQYAVQASEAVYFTNFKNDKKNDICKGTILSCNFTDVSKHFFVSMPVASYPKIQAASRHLGSGWYKVDLEFEVKHSYFNTLHQAVISIPHSMIKKITPNNSALVSKFSSTKHIAVNPTCSHDQLCLDENKQFESLTAILQSPVDVPVLISGPFGSGKTRIIARAAYEFAIDGLKPTAQQQIRILMCAHHSNTIETYLLKYFKPAFLKTKGVKIIRIIRKDQHYGRPISHNIIDRTITDLKVDVTSGQHISDPVLIVVTTYISSLQVAKVFNRFRFTHILLDEAAQVREPEAIAALSLGDANTKVVIAGDSKQVGPSVLVLGDESNQCGLGTSLLERLEALYINLSPTSPYLKQLGTNYRCHTNIVDFLSTTVYGYNIHCAVSPQVHPSASFPCVFYWCESSKAENPMNHEAEAVIRQVQYYFSKWPQNWKAIRRRDVCIISPFRAQLNIIKPILMDLKMKEITLLPSYVIQGHEFQAVILSTYEPLESDGTSSNPTKSLVDPKIFNTAVSRSKSLVVAVGDPFVLLKAERQFPEQCWKHYLEMCLENNTIYFHESYRPNKRKEAKRRLEEKIKQDLIRSKSEEQSGQLFDLQPTASKSGP